MFYNIDFFNQNKNKHQTFVSMLPTGPIKVVLSEEIAFEGLEGATLNTLWHRLSERLKIDIPLPELFCNQIWSIITENEEYEFFLLPEPRALYEPHNRIFNVEKDTGIFRELKKHPGNQFNYRPVDDNGIIGSCEHYAARKLIPRTEVIGSTCNEVEEKYGTLFVIVASQRLREKNIFPPTHIVDLSILQYCLLERIGRSRYNGETSHGCISLLELAKESSILFYNRKMLAKHKLITKQPFSQRSKSDIIVAGMIFHLPRYYTEMKPKMLLLIEKVVSELKTRPNCMAEYEEIKENIAHKHEKASKWFRSAEFTKHIRIDQMVPYRFLYPEAEQSEWMNKNSKEEKHLRVMQLVNPEVDVTELWCKEDALDEEKNGILDNSNEYLDMSILQQAYIHVCGGGDRGLTQAEIGIKMGVCRLSARSIVRNLTKIHVVNMYMSDEGRQRTSMYTTKSIGDSANNTLLGAHSVEMNLLNDVKAEMNEDLNESLVSRMEMDENEIIMQNSLYSSYKFSTDDLNIEICIDDHIIGQKKSPKGIGQILYIKKTSTRLLRRCNLIINSVKEDRLLDARAIQKKIMTEEKGLGYTDIVCYKSVFTLIGHLAVDKFIKAATVFITQNNHKKRFVYACDLAVNCDDPIFLAKIELAKARSGAPRPKEATPNSKDLNVFSMDESLPKFLRMKVMHEFLYYLIYGFSDKEVNVTNAEAIATWKPDYPNFDFETLDYEMTQIYSFPEVDWRMFVSPLINFPPYTDGWALLADITLRAPLSLFSQICTFQRNIPELNAYLMHPIRRHLLVKDLPTSLRSKLYFKRKYIFNFVEVCQRLCYVGLLQFGPQRLKEKDQVYVFLNKNACLLDTRSSAPGYLTVERKEYEEQRYTFNTLDDVDKFWTDLYTIATDTRLNRRSTMRGKEVMVEQLDTKPEMKEARKAQTPESALENDQGRLPCGNNLGAGGLDSAFFTHLRTNWTKNNVANKRRNHPIARRRHLEAAKKGHISKKKNTRKVIKPIAVRKQPKMNKRAKVLRLIPPKMPSEIKRKPFYDDVDKKALRLMNRLRVLWTPPEDNLLLICKVGLLYFYPDHKQNTMISHQIVRDILHWYSKKSLNKTSRAVQRRILYMLRNPTIASNIMVSLEEAKQNLIITEKFGSDFVQNIKQIYKTKTIVGQVLKVHFVNLVYKLSRILSKFKIAEDEENHTELIPVNTVEEFHGVYQKISSDYNHYVYKYDANPKDRNTVMVLTLTYLIHSAVSSLKEKTSWGLQLFNIYKMYEERILSLAMRKVRLDKFISLNKSSKTKPILTSKFMPTTNHPYHISISYYNQVCTGIPHDLVDNLYDFYVTILCNESKTENIEIKGNSAGMLTLFAELLTKNLIDLQIDMPSEGILLDPALKTDCVPYTDQINRYSDIYKIMQDDANENCDQAELLAPPPLPSPAPIRKEKPEKTKVKVYHESISVCCYTQHPIEKLMKLQDYYYHFFCMLVNLPAKIASESYHIDKETNFCSAPYCILSEYDHNITKLVLNIIDKNQKILIKIKDCQTKRIEYLKANHIIKEENIVQIFNKLVATYEYQNKKLFDKDFGHVVASKYDVINIVEIIEEIICSSCEDEDYEWIKDFDTYTDYLKEDSLLTTTTHPSRSIPDELSEKIHKLHNLFVVNSSKIFVKMKKTNPEEKVILEGFSVSKELLPNSFEKRSDIYEKITSDAIWPQFKELEPKLEEAKGKLKENKLINDILEFIESAREIGVTPEELANHYCDEDTIKLAAIMESLIKCKFVLRAGFKTAIYVYWKFADIWTIKTFHLTRKMRESLKPISASEVAAASKDKDKDNEIESQEGTSSSKRSRENEDVEEEEPIRRLSKRTKREQHQHVEEEDVQQEIGKPLTLVIAPWIKVNGALNRRLFDRWISTIVLYCCSHPGVTLDKICHRFSFLSPYHIRYLLKLLQSFECLKINRLSRQNVSLLSNYKVHKIVEATDFDIDEEVFVEVAEDVLSKLSLFIGTKKYRGGFPN